LPARRCQRVAFSIFLCFFLRIRLRRFLISDPISCGRLAVPVLDCQVARQPGTPEEAARGVRDCAPGPRAAGHARLRTVDMDHAFIPVLRWAATCFARVGERSDLQVCGEALGEHAARFGSGESLSALAHTLGEVAALDSQAAAAAAQFERAINLIEDWDLPRERIESQLRAAAACAAAGRHDAAVAFAREAGRGAARLGARPLAQASADLLRQLGEPLGGAQGPHVHQRAQRGGLTARQLEIMVAISRGQTDKQIARALRLSPRTVEMHVARALATLDCRTRAAAVRRAGELGVLPRSNP